MQNCMCLYIYIKRWSFLEKLSWKYNLSSSRLFKTWKNIVLKIWKLTISCMSISYPGLVCSFLNYLNIIQAKVRFKSWTVLIKLHTHTYTHTQIGKKMIVSALTWFSCLQLSLHSVLIVNKFLLASIGIALTETQTAISKN